MIDLLPECNAPNRQFCETCRKRRDGRAFRETILTVRGVEADPDFDCPRSLPWIKESPQGIGDTIASFTKRLGIKPCGGCKKRQAKLNKLFPYKD